MLRFVYDVWILNPEHGTLLAFYIVDDIALYSFWKSYNIKIVVVGWLSRRTRDIFQIQEICF
jgi:hypothetical protein